MKKSDKKTERILCDKLTEVCEETLITNQAKAEGFEWLTHTVNYQNVSASLKVICVFDTVAAMQKAENNHIGNELRQLIINKLAEQRIVFNNSIKQISFDNEEACETQHQGNWNVRFKSH